MTLNNTGNRVQTEAGSWLVLCAERWLEASLALFLGHARARISNLHQHSVSLCAGAEYSITSVRHCFNDIEDEPGSMDESAANLQPWEWQGRFRLRSGEEKWVQGAARPERLANGDILWDGLLIDITERKRIEEAARKAKEEAERANAAKREFLSRMSHELRTPLHSILGFGQLLKMDTLSSEQEENVDRVLAAGHHLLKLVDEVLHISRIEAGNLALAIEPVLLRNALRAAIDLVQSMAVVRNVRINELACDQYILADQQRLKQVLLNLLSNAVKYNRSGGSVTLSVAETARGTLRLMISDNGPGIAPNDAAKLFIPFERLRAADSKIEGIGLGLAISKRLIELMSGEIGFESVPHNGSTFWIELPLAEGGSQFRLRSSRSAIADWNLSRRDSGQ
jgi:signal transduction histidine kinase